MRLGVYGLLGGLYIGVAIAIFKHWVASQNMVEFVDAGILVMLAWLCCLRGWNILRALWRESL